MNSPQVVAFGKLGHKLYFGDDSRAIGAKWEPERMLDLFLDEVRPGRVVLVSAHNEIPQRYRDRGVVSYAEYGITDYHLVEELLFYEHFDSMIFWVGDNAVSLPIPNIAGPRVGEPCQGLSSDINHTAPIVKLVNAWMSVNPLKHQPRFLHPDMRYPLKARDFSFPLRVPIYSQLAFTYNRKLYDHGNPRVEQLFVNNEYLPGTLERTEFANVWQTHDQYEYAGTETLAVAGSTWRAADQGDRQGTCIIANYIKRAPARDMLIAFLRGCDVTHFGAGWGDAATSVPQVELLDTMARFKAGVVPTASAHNDAKAGAATLKFWEHVLAGIIPIAPPGYDAQHNLPFPAECRAKDYDDLERIIQRVQLMPVRWIAEWQQEALAIMAKRARSLCWRLVQPV